jgi:multiple antibiotic resistance protein
LLVLFLFCGHFIMHGLNLELPALSIAGGLVLFIIALKMLFPSDEHKVEEKTDEEPFIVPLAIPLTAGPSALATVMLFSSRYPTHMMSLLLALVIVTVVFLGLVLSGSVLMRILGKSGLVAMERLMGLILITIAVQMFLHGVVQFLQSTPLA